MTLNELTEFLLPELSDPLQLGALLTISLLLCYTIIMTHRAARPASWEKKWNGGTPDDKDDDLDIEHGSVTDLWHAVATSHEKLAEIMPGLLLVVGLLGTFIGLGMALNNASHLLGQSEVITSNSMDDLMQLLNNLGNKFKTSTWGIAGFIILKAWSEAIRFDEKRLTWVIGKVKSEIESRKNEKLATENHRLELLFSQLSELTGNITSSIGSLEKKFDNDSTHTKQQEQTNSLLRDICAATTMTGNQMTAFTVGTRDIVQQMADAGIKMASGSTQVSDAAEGLKRVVDEFSQEFKQVLTEVRVELGKAIESMSKEAAETLKTGSEELSKATGSISAALQSQSESVKETLNGVQETTFQSFKEQKRIQTEFLTSIEQITESTEEFNQELKATRSKITAGLKSVSNTRQLLSEAIRPLKKTVPEIVARLFEISSLNEPLKEATTQLQKTVQYSATEQIKVGEIISTALSKLTSSQQQLERSAYVLESAIRLIVQKPDAGSSTSSMDSELNTPCSTRDLNTPKVPTQNNHNLTTT